MVHSLRFVGCEDISEEEEAKLRAVFGLDVKDVQLLIEVTVFVFERVRVRHRVTGTLLKKLQLWVGQVGVHVCLKV